MSEAIQRAEDEVFAFICGHGALDADLGAFAVADNARIFVAVGFRCGLRPAQINRPVAGRVDIVYVRGQREVRVMFKAPSSWRNSTIHVLFSNAADGSSAADGTEVDFVDTVDHIVDYLFAGKLTVRSMKGILP